MKNKPPFADQLACFTGEIVGGIIAGIGLGIIITISYIKSLDHQLDLSPLLKICAFGCVIVGSVIARSARLKRLSKHDFDETHDA